MRLFKNGTLGEGNINACNNGVRKEGERYVGI